jgi:glycosyltransferase involved in cell wall biosynthesis
MGLPNLLYVGDVAVESTVAGELLLHRLLSQYPEDRLTIAESNLCKSDPADRLPGVEYTTFDIGYPRLRRTRFARWYGSWLHLKARWVPSTLERLAQEVQPDAILTVWHGYSWITASALAQEKDIPLHLILHDDAPNLESRTPPLLKNLHCKDFERVYKQAESRLCVSPAMEREYKRRYGVPGDVLYPARGWEAPEYDHPPKKVGCEGKDVKIGYAGSLHPLGFKEAIGEVAKAAEPAAGEVVVYSNVSRDELSEREWLRDNVCLNGFVPPCKIIQELRREVDILLLVSSFQGRYRETAKTNFQSKMTDYTATGLPILVWGPEDSSTVKWATENSGVAKVVTSPLVKDVRSAVQQLARNPEARYDYGATALKVGKEYFDPQVAWEKFSKVVSK